MYIAYFNHLPHKFSAAAVRLFLDALGEKLVPVLGDDARAQSVLQQSLDPTRCVAAVCDGELAGLLAIKDHEGGFITPTLRAMTQMYGLLGGLYRVVGLAFLHHAVAPDEFYVDGVAVVDALRGQGVGSQLFARFEQRALEKGIRTLSLTVIDTNPRAEALYERLGFVPVKQERLWPLNRIFGLPFESDTLMIKKIG
jgi:GNAT superfamily N-acetyltransferase